MSLWYACYGSNLSLARFRCYLEGGRPAGAGRVQTGCRDGAAPTGDRPLTLPGQVRFAGHAPAWGGGVAFFDPDGPGVAPGRAYRLTVEQLADVVAQENGLAPGAVAVDVPAVTASGRLTACPGWYGGLVHIGELGGEPVLTITSPDGADRPAAAPPSAAYLRTIATGLAEAHGWSPAAAAAHLLTCPGVVPTWSARALEEACSDRLSGMGYSTPSR